MSSEHVSQMDLEQFVSGLLESGPCEALERHVGICAACERALCINAVSYSSVSAILKSGLDQARACEPVKATPAHANIRGGDYYQ